MSDFVDILEDQKKDARIAKLEAELAEAHAENAETYSTWLTTVEQRAVRAEAERDQANTSAIAQRRSFEKALEGRDEIIAELEALYERRLPCREAEVAQARYEKAEADVAEMKLKYDILAQADAYGHPDHETICGDYPESVNDWLAGLIAWMREFDDMDPGILRRWDKRSTP